MSRKFFLTIVAYLSFCLSALAAPETHAPQDSVGATADMLSFSEPLYLEISVKDCQLSAYKKHPDGLFELVGRFPVATAKIGLPKYPSGKGFAVRVELDPSWKPTDYSVDYMNRQLEKKGLPRKFTRGEIIGPKDPRNAMGKFKIYLSHFVPGKGRIYRIHGTNNPESIGKRATGGCIRMGNSDGAPLAQNIQQRLQRRETVEVDIVK